MVTKRENACFEQFLLLSPSFQKPSAAEAPESVFIWERINHPDPDLCGKMYIFFMMYVYFIKMRFVS